MCFIKIARYISTNIKKQNLYAWKKETSNKEKRVCIQMLVLKNISD
jgi:hypothetical protein